MLVLADAVTRVTRETMASSANTIGKQVSAGDKRVSCKSESDRGAGSCRQRLDVIRTKSEL